MVPARHHHFGELTLPADGNVIRLARAMPPEHLGSRLTIFRNYSVDRRYAISESEPRLLGPLGLRHHVVVQLEVA
jgi:hypothetical protein